MKSRILILVVSIGLGLAVGRDSYGAPASVEGDLEAAQAKLADFDRSLTFHDRKSLRQTSERDLGKLDPGLQGKYNEREVLKADVASFEYMTDLKSKLLALPGRDAFESGPAGLQREKEAEAIVRTIVPAFAELRKHYEMIRPAILHNFLVNVGLKEQGFCWHWARDLTDRLRTLNLKTFDLLWATARGQTMREHNTVVLVSPGHPLEDGLLLDGWRHAGKPFWMLVTDDKNHPWKLGQYYGGGAETSH